MRRRLLAIIAILVVALFALIACGYAEALRDPVVRRASIAMADWPVGEPPRTVLLVSDVHVGGPDMPPERLAHIVGRLNALHPDLILLAGDFISHKVWTSTAYPPERIAATLAGLRAPLGTLAVLGNHDQGGGMETMLSAAFARHGIAVLDNRAERRGPFRIGGIDDISRGRPDIPAMEAGLAALGGGPSIVLAHNPDMILNLSQPVDVVLAGHTHCGQVVVPGFGPIATMSRHGRRFSCGRIAEGRRLLFVAAGLGTSILPLRLGAPPDVWLLRFGPVR